LPQPLESAKSSYPTPINPCDEQADPAGAAIVGFSQSHPIFIVRALRVLPDGDAKSKKRVAFGLPCNLRESQATQNLTMAS
jgi:hypothetical protein